MSSGDSTNSQDARSLNSSNRNPLSEVGLVNQQANQLVNQANPSEINQEVSRAGNPEADP